MSALRARVGKRRHAGADFGGPALRIEQAALLLTGSPVPALFAIGAVMALLLFIGVIVNKLTRD
jgi:hypothetical protein